MAKRFTATEKWVDPWFCGLNQSEKLFWIYLLDNCNHAGIWQVNWPLVEFYMPDFDKDISSFNGRIKVLSDQKWFIPKFIEFQYGELNQENRAHKSVIDILNKVGAYKGLVSPMEGRKDKDKDKVKDKEREIIDFFNSTCGTKFKHTPTNIKIIGARLKEGFTKEDCERVIRKKHLQWKDDPEMKKYIRIETLFRPTKFESYLNEKTKEDEVPGWLANK